MRECNALILIFPKEIRQKKHRKIHGFGFSLMCDGCVGLLQLLYFVMFVTCAVFS
jgi:hypothetical protein